MIVKTEKTHVEVIHGRGRTIFELPSREIIEKYIKDAKFDKNIDEMAKKYNKDVFQFKTDQKVKVTFEIKSGNEATLFVEFPKEDLRLVGYGWVGVDASKILHCKIKDLDEVECEGELDGAEIFVYRDESTVVVGKKGDNLFWV